MGARRIERDRGDLTERAFQHAVSEAAVRHWRAAIRKQLSPGETVLADHHVVRGQLRLGPAILREPQEESLSLFVTQERVLRVRAILAGDGSSAASEACVDELALARIRDLKLRRRVRTGEAVTGVVIAVLAVLCSPLLLVTAKLLVAVGALGVLHALLLPTSSLEMTVEGDMPEPPFEVSALRTKSGRRLVSVLREHMLHNNEQG
jgi:hypothetical protein